MLPARPNFLFIGWFDLWCRRAMREAFNRVQVFPETPGAWSPLEPDRSHLYVANHSSFWDGIVLNHLLRSHRRQPLYCMIDAVQVAAHPFFRRVGGFSVDRASPRDGMRAIEYAAGLLNGRPCSMVIFPQGRIEPNDARPLRFEAGVARLIERARGVRVAPVAMRYEFWQEQRAEALVAVGTPRRYEQNSHQEVLADLQSSVTSMLAGLKTRGLTQEASPLVALHGKSSISHWRERLPGRRKSGVRRIIDD